MHSANPSQSVDSLRAQARTALESRRASEAAQIYERLIGLDPGDREALGFLAGRALAMGDGQQARRWFACWHEQAPGDPDAILGLGRALAQQGELQQARSMLETGLRMKPGAFMARFALGELLLRQGDETAAVLQLYRAILDAQTLGRWLNDASTHPSMRLSVQNAIALVTRHRLQMYDRVIEPIRQTYGSMETARVDRCLRIYLQIEAPDYPDARQRPKFLYFPGLPATPYFARQHFPWLTDLEARTSDILAEFQAIAGRSDLLQPFLADRPSEAADSYLAGSAGLQSWNAYFFYRHGQRYPAHCEQCPQTIAVLDACPLVRIREHGPEICFSLLAPGSHILPHQGVTNTRAVVHLPLVVPEDCALTVGSEIHRWRVGEAVAFDDTFMHEAWNRSNRLRAIVLMDAWNPHLSACERAAVTALVEAIGDFNTRTEQPLMRE